MTDTRPEKHPSRDEEYEENFFNGTRREAPIAPGLWYSYSCEPHELEGKPCPVLRTRVTGRGPEGRSKAKFEAVYTKPAPARSQKVICLHFTAGGFKGSLGALTQDVRDAQRGPYVSVPYMIARSGRIYEIHDDKWWANSSSRGGSGNEETVAIELINVGPLIKSDKGYHMLGPGGAPGGIYCKLDEQHLVHTLEKPFRGHVHFAKHTDKQYDALKKLLGNLTQRLGIAKRFLPAPDPLDPTAPRYIKAPLDKNWTGIASHVNFQDKGKWDIGPAFDWDRLMREDLALPVPAKGIGAPEVRGSADAFAKTVDDEVVVTRAALDRLYDHTEKDSAQHGGSYPVGVNTLWHGGVHLFVDKVPIHASFDGQVVAARLRTPTLDGGQTPENYGSAAFILVRHTLTPELVGALEPLLVPTKYLATKIGEDAPGLEFTSSTSLPKDFWFEVGDAFVRTDLERSRTPRSKKGTAYPVRVASLASGLVNARRVVVTAVTPKKQTPHTPVLELAGGGTFDLEIADQLTFLKNGKHTHHPARGFEDKKYDVELTKLARSVSTVKSYKVKAASYLAFRNAPEPPPPDLEPTEDDGRLADLVHGDELEVVDVSTEEGELDDWIEVKVTKLADKEDVERLKLGLATKRLLLSNADANKVACALEPGDELAIVQREARVIEAPAESAPNATNADQESRPSRPADRYDLVKILALAAKPLVPQSGVSATVKPKKCLVYDSPGLKKGAGKKGDRKVIGELTQGDEVTVVDPSKGSWIEVGGAASGWVESKALALTMVDRPDANWLKEIVDRGLAFVKTFSEADLKTAKRKARAATEGTKGWVRVPSPGLSADGTKRDVKHHAMLHKTGTIQFDPAFFRLDGDKGDDRQVIFHSVLKESGHGKLAYDPERTPESRAVREEVAQTLTARPFYALYMHLDDRAAIDQKKDDAPRFGWIPRVVTELTLKQPDTFTVSSGEVVNLVPGDKLAPIEPWSTDQPSGERLLEWTHIEDGDVVAKITVKPHKGRRWLVSLSGRSRRKVALLTGGTVLVPTVMQIGKYNDSQRIDARLDGKPRWPVRAVATSASPKTDDGKPVGIRFAKGEVVVELAVDGDQAFVRSQKRSLEGWLPTKVLGPATDQVEADTRGTILWNDALYTASTLSRTSVYKHLANATGHVPSLALLAKPERSTLDQSVSKELLARFERREVVTFPLVPKGEHSSTLVNAGQLLWDSGTFAPVLTREAPTPSTGKLIHWEIFSPQPILPGRPFKADEKVWSEVDWPWWEVQDTDDNWTMNCEQILRLVGKGVEGDASEKEREKIVGEILNPKELESLYSNADVASKLRHAGCMFKLEWAVDPKVGLQGMRSAKFDDKFWSRLKQRFAGGSPQDWAQFVDHDWIDRQSRYFSPVLWWNDAHKNPAASATGLPGSPMVWHYNPIAFLEAFSSATLSR